MKHFPHLFLAGLAALIFSSRSAHAGIEYQGGKISRISGIQVNSIQYDVDVIFGKLYSEVYGVDPVSPRFFGDATNAEIAVRAMVVELNNNNATPHTTYPIQTIIYVPVSALYTQSGQYNGTSGYSADANLSGQWAFFDNASASSTASSEHWGYTVFSLSSSSAVPEPSTAIAMGLLGIVGFAGNRRRRTVA